MNLTHLIVYFNGFSKRLNKGEYMSTIDIALVVMYLIVTLWIGYRSGRHVKTMEDYSVASKTLPTAALVATIFATWAGGDDLVGTGEVYRAGIIFLIINLAQIINVSLQAYVVAPKILKNFSDKVSIGEIMGELYGKIGRIMTGIATIGVSLGRIAMQISCFSYLCALIPGISHTEGIVMGSVIVILYSAYGGIRSVVYTDILQFGILIVAIPVMANVALYNIGGIEALVSQVPDFYFSLSPFRTDFLTYFGIFCVCAFPHMGATLIQRTLMAKDAKQANHSLVIVGGLFIPFYVAVALIALCAVITYPGCEPNTIFFTVLDKSLPPIMKGFAVIGVLAVIMSSADSHINVASISVTRDIALILFPNMSNKSQLILARICTVILGTGAIILATSMHRVIDFWVYCAKFWMPMITAPMILYLLNIRTNIKQYVFSAVLGVLATAINKSFGLKELSTCSPIIGMLTTMSIFCIKFRIRRLIFKKLKIV